MYNMTPHEIVIQLKNGTQLRFPPSGTVARVQTLSEPLCEVNGIPVVINIYGPVEGLMRDSRGIPLPQIVSGMVLAALPKGTPNIYAPATGATAIRKNGQVIAVTELVAC